MSSFDQVGAECNWGVRFSTDEEALKFVANLSSEVCNRLSEAGVRGRLFTLKVKKRKPGTGEPVKFMGCGHCDNLSRSTALPQATADVSIVERLSRQLYHVLAVPPKEIRGVGIGVTRLEEDTGGAVQGGGISSWLEKWGKEGGGKREMQGGGIGSVLEKRDVEGRATIEEGIVGIGGKSGGGFGDEPFLESRRGSEISKQEGASEEGVGRSDHSRGGGVGGNMHVRERQANDYVNRLETELPKEGNESWESCPTSPPLGTQQKKRLLEIKAGKAKAEYTQPEPPPSGGSVGFPPATELDPDVLAELPADIRAEIEQAYKQQGGGMVSNSGVKERAEFLESSKSGVQETSGFSGGSKSGVRKNSGFGGGSKSGVKENSGFGWGSKRGAEEISGSRSEGDRHDRGTTGLKALGKCEDSGVSKTSRVGEGASKSVAVKQTRVVKQDSNSIGSKDAGHTFRSQDRKGLVIQNTDQAPKEHAPVERPHLPAVQCPDSRTLVISPDGGATGVNRGMGVAGRHSPISALPPISQVRESTQRFCPCQYSPSTQGMCGNPTVLLTKP
jgi:hypothetical protein